MAWAPSTNKTIGPALPYDDGDDANANANANANATTASHLPCRLAAELPGHDGPVLAARFNATGAYLVTGGRDRTLRLWNPHRAAAAEAAAAGGASASADDPLPSTTHQPIKVYRGGHGYEVRDVSVSADSAQLASVGGDRAVVLWDVPTGAVLRRLTGERGGDGGGGGAQGGGGKGGNTTSSIPLAGPIHAVRHHSAHPNLLLTGGADRALRVWDLRARGGGGGGGGAGGGRSSGGGDNACVQCCRPFLDDVSCVAEGPGQAQLSASSVDGTVAVFDCRKGLMTRDEVAGGVPVTALHVPEGGLALLAACGDGRARLLDAAGGEMLAEYGPPAVAGRRRRASKQPVEGASKKASRWGPPPPGAPSPRRAGGEDEGEGDEDEQPPAHQALAWVRCATTPPDDGAVVTTSGGSLVYWDYATGAEVARVERAAGGSGGGSAAAAARVSALAVAAVPQGGDGLAAAAGFVSACCAATGGTDGRVRVWR